MNENETKRMGAWLAGHPKAWAKRMGRAKSVVDLAALAGAVKVDGVAAFSSAKAGERLAELIDERRLAAIFGPGGQRKCDANLRLVEILEGVASIAPFFGVPISLAFSELGLEAVSGRAKKKLAKELGS